MINAIRSIRAQSPAALTFTQSLHPANCYLGRKPSRVGFRQASTTTQSTEPDSEPEMEDKSKDKPHMESGDSMTHSFGEGYSTRCDDDGFGGIYGNNQTVDQTDKKELIHENHPAYDKSMTHSFGEGYSTRCDDDGFGGIYGNNQTVDQTDKKELIHENHPDYDKTQGSEVKEKEKARHQTHVASNNY